MYMLPVEVCCYPHTIWGSEDPVYADNSTKLCGSVCGMIRYEAYDRSSLRTAYYLANIIHTVGVGVYRTAARNGSAADSHRLIS